MVASIICNYKGDDWEKRVRSVLYDLKNDSVPNYAREIVGDDGVPSVYYEEENGIKPGKQFNATIIANYAINYYKNIDEVDTATKRKFNNCINWLIKNIAYKNGYALYSFNWQQAWYPSVKGPFTCAMSSGRAIEAFTKAFQLHNDSIYLHHAKHLIKGFYLPIENGGFTYQERNGWWYEEVADENLKTPRILDGHIYAITGVREYWLQTNDDSAKIIIDKGLAALKHNLPNYDAGNGEIYYDAFRKKADKKYQKIITSQLKQLHEITSDAVFLSYYEKWNDPQQSFYVMRVIEEGNLSGMVLIGTLTLIISIIITLLLRLIQKN